MIIQRSLLALALLVPVSGCTIDELILTEAEAQDLADHFEASVHLTQDLVDYGFGLSAGDADLSGRTYEAPSAENGWVGTITGSGALLPHAAGDLVVSFSVLGDGVPVDPYTIDLSTAGSVEFAADVTFHGISDEGDAIDVDASFTLLVTLDGGLEESAILNGDFSIRHGSYIADLRIEEFEVVFDLATESAVRATGSIRGTIDIPNYVFDAQFHVSGDAAGNLLADVSISGTHLHDEIPLADV